MTNLNLFLLKTESEAKFIAFISAKGSDFYQCLQ
ncbi:hypothetical protein Halhy_2782 [Haliscomenobacter hydrossis DSM 1100]|uniref:Uncharacterized protein n=1 Tax=Haliscomenobacter hydrossis (strain ATCC 27775 / DSM 1100 / LMG 10767 / O) TaxID=760192 RepID=F4L217_HALH1|nr:hypothetical protein Halhy_2782 [Haliscomenobacter hydrossis DSM 1100]